MKIKSSAFGILLLLISNVSFSSDNYTLDSKLSSVSFATIKNQFVIEPATINTLSGMLDNNGQFDIHVNLNGIDTGIPIRNMRLNDLFFETGKQSPVKVEGNIDWNSLTEGSHKESLYAKVTLFGKTKLVKFPVVILNAGNTIMVSSSAPVIISASDFGIPSKNLIALADTVGGIKISDRVPLTLNLTFSK
ncbi:polyisoprenoid-binding protein YceI [Vibrio crassostreae]|uniref:YceI family protein n=1 Tax=Vibrio crassostreae TaxID=246167 RepID=UPI001199F6E1|nr:YceI family protein [Vibrio crassostreae]TWD40953.1 polyisoprenoid-binding protein YceI [Vibrio crassostreae]